MSEFDLYQESAMSTAIYPPHFSVIYPALGLAGEAGEVAERVKKGIRDNDGVFDREAIKKELGDVLWYVANLAADLEINLNEVAEANLRKLSDRAARKVLNGDGDNR